MGDRFWNLDREPKANWRDLEPVIYHECVWNAIERRVDFDVIKDLAVIH